MKSDILRPGAVHRFFYAASRGNDLLLFEPKRDSIGVQSRPTMDDSPAAVFTFGRQSPSNGGLCLADYASPPAPDGTIRDSVALFVVSVGHGLRTLAEKLRDRGDYLRTHVLQALALESAEAYAELVHQRIREAWGFQDFSDLSLIERFQAKYRGKRYSFGYPACPLLDDQALLFRLLNPAEIGVQLTDGFMMDPEASVSAVVFHHPKAAYFSVGSEIAGKGAVHGYQRL